MELTKDEGCLTSENRKEAYFTIKDNSIDPICITNANNLRYSDDMILH